MRNHFGVSAIAYKKISVYYVLCAERAKDRVEYNIWSVVIKQLFALRIGACIYFNAPQNMHYNALYSVLWFFLKREWLYEVRTVAIVRCFLWCFLHWMWKLLRVRAKPCMFEIIFLDRFKFDIAKCLFYPVIVINCGISKFLILQGSFRLSLM